MDGINTRFEMSNSLRQEPLFINKLKSVKKAFDALGIDIFVTFGPNF